MVEIEWRRDGASFPLTAFDGSGNMVVLDGSTTLAVSTVYRCPLLIKDNGGISIQWQQTAAGAGAIASHRFLVSNVNEIDAADLDKLRLWSDVSATYAFTAMPAGAEGSEHYPISGILATAMQLELTTGAAPVTGVSFLAQVR